MLVKGATEVKMKMWGHNADLVSFLLRTENFCRQTSRTMENQEANANFTVLIEQKTKYSIGWPLVYEDNWCVYSERAATVP